MVLYLETQNEDENIMIIFRVRVPVITINL